jgi:uncharacterized protein YbjT (DUF2867 family)
MGSDVVGAPILVTAAGGTVGAALAEELRAAGRRVRGAFHSRTAADAVTAIGHEAVVVDFDDAATLPAAMDAVDSVFLIVPTGPEQPRQELGLLAAAKAAGVRRIVKLSVWRADELLTPIARLHRPVEEAVEDCGLSWTVLRPNFYMQNFVRQMAGRIKTEGVIAQPESTAPISFVDTRDVARVAAHVLTSDGHASRTYDITGPQALTYEQVAETFSSVLDKRVRFVGLSEEEAKAGMLQRGLTESYADALIAVSRAYRDGGAEMVAPTVRVLTGREPVSFERFVRDHRSAFA